MTTRRCNVLDATTVAAVQGEARHAVHKHGVRNTPLGAALTREQKLAVLVEEVGEVARALTYDQDDAGLLGELYQVAAVALMWAQQERPVLRAARTAHLRPERTA